MKHTPLNIPLSNKGEATDVTSLGVFEREEARMGRTHWTVADYREEGRRLFDKQTPRPGMERMHASLREHFATEYARLACPPAKRATAVREANGNPGMKGQPLPAAKPRGFQDA